MTNTRVYAEQLQDENQVNDAENIDVSNEEQIAETTDIDESPIHGIYVSAYVAGTKSMMDEIIENIDKVDHSEGLGLWDRWRYKSLLRRELRSCLYRYRRYRWLTLKKNRPIYANTSAVLAFCRKVWLEKIKPAIHNRTSKKQ